MTQNLFDIKIGYAYPKNPIALASMAGITDSSFALRFEHAGLIVLGGYNLDERTNEAAKKEIGRGRKEFVSDEPFEFLESELEAASRIGTTIAINVRASSLPPFIRAAQLAKRFNSILEINAHCRQPEMVESGAGEALLKDAARLCEYAREIKKTGVVLSVKTRANVVNDVELALALEKAGVDIIHIDAMHPNGLKNQTGIRTFDGAQIFQSVDLGVIKRVRNATDLFIIGNNSVVDFESAKEMFSRGADMVSVARGVLANPLVINELVFEATSIQSMTGWYNAPKHICGGGDLRALAFCCLPIKPCALHYALKEVGLSPEEFMKIKLEFARGTPIERGEGTCFGSMTWCCKITKPCFLRDGVLTASGLSDVEYMRIKKMLSEHILKHRKK